MSFAGVSFVERGQLLSSSTASGAADMAAAGYNLLVIKGYRRTKARFPNGHHVYSRPFMVGGHRWRIMYYPNGVDSTHSDSVSIFLVIDKGEDGLPVRLKVQVGFCFIDQVQCLLPVYDMYKYATHRSKVGFSSFRKQDYAVQSKHLQDDCLTIRCDVVLREAGDHTGGNTAIPLNLPPPSQLELRRSFGCLLDTAMGADVMFEVSGQTFHVHRCVLAARSKVFKAELFGSMKESAAGSIIRIDDMDPVAFRALLEFIYTGSPAEVQSDRVEGPEIVDDLDAAEAKFVRFIQQVLVAADIYDLEGLKKKCGEMLIEYIEDTTVVDMLVLADQHHCRVLKDACSDFLRSLENRARCSVM